LNPPVIQITYPDRHHEESSNEPSALPPPVEQSAGRSLNPFLNVQETSVESEAGEMTDSMMVEVDDGVSVPVKETNPFRRSFDEREG